MPRTFYGTFETDLANNALTICRLWEITKRDGNIVRLTDHSKNISFGGNTFASDGGFSISALETGENLAVDNAEFNVLFKSTAVSQVDILNGAFDGASVQCWLVNYENVANYCILPGAYLIKVKTADTDSGVFELASISSKLNQSIGKFCVPTCDADLGDSRCAVSLGAFTVTGTLTGVTDNRIFTDSSRAEADDYFNYGKLTWTSGNNNGLSFEVIDFGSGQFTLAEFCENEIQVGDTYSVYRGCDRLTDTCKNVFNNFERFRGFPFNVSDVELYGGAR